MFNVCIYIYREREMYDRLIEKEKRGGWAPDFAFFTVFVFFCNFCNYLQ